MFTGIIEHTGRIEAVTETAGGRRLVIDAGPCAADLAPGASLAVNGVCLTVVTREDARLSFDVITETLRRSNLGRLRAGDPVNLERCLRAGDRIDGHFVQGHVDGVATVDRRDAGASEFKLWLQVDAALRPYIVPKGGIALDGVSLTIADIDGDRFSVALIPTTLDRTTLGRRNPGDTVNVETDILARIVVHQLRIRELADGLSIDTLRQHGFASSP